MPGKIGTGLCLLLLGMGFRHIFLLPGMGFESKSRYAPGIGNPDWPWMCAWGCFYETDSNSFEFCQHWKKTEHSPSSP